MYPLPVEISPPTRPYFPAPQVTDPLPTLRTVQTGRPSTTVLPIPRAVTAALLTACRMWSPAPSRSEEHTSELQSLMRISYAVFCLKNKTDHHITYQKYI